jgi:DNA-binding NtrC family response regulator
MITFTIYIVDDEESIRQGVSYSLQEKYQVKTFATAEESLEALKHETPDLILLDIRLPGMNGLEALEKIKALHPEIFVLMLTAYDEIDTVISAMKHGAYDYIIKPLHIDSLRASVKNALDTIKMRKEIQLLQEHHLKEHIPGFITESDAIQDVMEVVQKVAQSPDTPILIIGATGTGKELIARTIHYKSPQFQGPFVALNCAAIPKELIESELFGYEKGAFSGAIASGKKGLVEEAAGGTLFLDEVGDLSLEAQAKLLRFLEAGEFYHLGSTKKIRVKTRIIAATNKDPKRMIDAGLFRVDLFYRLAVVKLEVPSLDERRQDIVPIAKYFLLEFAKKYGKQFHDMAPETEHFLKNYHWKGNIRELRNLIERGVLIGTGPVLRLSDLGVSPGNKTPPQSETPGGFPPLPDDGLDLEALEAHYIREALQKAHGNDAKAAQLLKMSYYTFRYRKKKLAI